MEYDLNTYIWRWLAVCYEYLVYHIPAPKTSPHVKGINLVQIKVFLDIVNFELMKGILPKVLEVKTEIVPFTNLMSSN